VRDLLQTRCETNKVLFGQLVQHVGLEGQVRGPQEIRTDQSSSISLIRGE
jgi:hypothetical protein